MMTMVSRTKNLNHVDDNKKIDRERENHRIALN